MVHTHGLVIANESSDILNSQFCALGDAQYALELSGASTYLSTPSTGTASGPYKALKVSINGTAYYILAASSYS